MKALVFVLVFWLVLSYLDYQDVLAEDCAQSGGVFNPADSTCAKSQNLKGN